MAENKDAEYRGAGFAGRVGFRFNFLEATVSFLSVVASSLRVVCSNLASVERPSNVA